MQSVENTCCVVSVLCSDTGERLSCSGIIIRHAGVVICSGVLFRFLDKQYRFSSNQTFILPEDTGRKLNIQVEYHEPCVKMNECSGEPYAAASQLENPVSSHSAELLMMVNCPEFRSAIQSLFREADKWSLIEGEDSGIRNLDVLSWFAVLGVPQWKRENVVPYMRSDALRKGRTVITCGSPFGSMCPDLFMGTLSKGIVSNLFGEDNVVILTDARCLPGTEGGGVFVKDRRLVYLVGLIVAPLCWRSSDWIGLSLVCSFHVILRNIRKSTVCSRELQESVRHIPSNISSKADTDCLFEDPAIHSTVALVEVGRLWGSGVLHKHLVLTCRHVVDGKSVATVKIHENGRFNTVTGQVVFSTKTTSPYDIAVIQLNTAPPGASIPRFASSFKPGEDVVVVGYGAFGSACGPSMSGGILSRVVSHRSQPVMLQTTCAVQAGASGGAVLRADTGELLGIVSSNTRDFVAEVTYPHLNFSIPVTVLEPLLSLFATTGDANVFEELNRVEEGVRTVWRLQNTQSRL